MENFTETTICLLSIEYQKGYNKPIKKYVFVNGYYSASIPGDRQSGLIERLMGWENESRLIKLEGYIQEINDSLDISSLTFDFNTYTQIAYLDLMGNDIYQYYNTSNGRGQLISREKGEELFDDYFNTIKNGELVELDTIDKIYIKKLMGLNN